ncbi:CPBP family intramembrane glutamic endopeptidase [Radiobacillus deserti]|nr:CPBP family intramembrane glutamic endopeptidase [Radiobacillus deserti]
MSKQVELLRGMSSKEVYRQVLLSQFIFILLAFGLSFFLFDSMTVWFELFTWNWINIVVFAILPAITVVLIDLILFMIVPNQLDDGGINEIIFSNRTTWELVSLCAVVGVSEEVLFRGVIQTTFGLITASVIFAIIHVRYLNKPLLLISVVLLSFLLGYIYEVTQSLVYSMVAHFIIDVLLGFLIRFTSK